MSLNWEKAFSLLRYLREQGYKGYIVGGAVRDYLLNKEEKDIDVVTDANVEEIRQLFPKAKQPSSTFPMFLVPWQSLTIEVSPFRDGAATISEDLAFRDFTINALALNDEKKLIDPYGGRKDLSARLLRSIAPEKRFQEDPLRILRMFRFAGELSFEIERETFRIACTFKQLLSSVPVERIQSEMERLLMAPHHEVAFQKMLQSDIIVAFPVSIRPERETFSSRSWNFDFLPTHVERWTAFLWNIYGREAEKKWSHWRFSKKMTRFFHLFFQTIDKNQPFLWNKINLYEMGIERALQIERLNQWIVQKRDENTLIKMVEQYEKLPIHSRKDLLIGGKDIVTLFPNIEKQMIGKLLKDLEQKVLYGEVNNEKEALASYVKEKIRYEE